jgi:hypothetical protein
MRSRTPVALGLALVALATAPAAHAAYRFAAPDGAFTGTCTSASSPCRLEYVRTVTGIGDQVVVFAGTYDLIGPVNFTKGEWIYGYNGRPRIRGSAVGDPLFAVHNGGTVQNLRFEQSGPQPALAVESGLVLNVLATNTYSGSGENTAVRLDNGGTAREVVAHGTGSGAIGLDVNGGSAQLRNVTAYANQANGTALFIGSGAGGSPSVTARNVIARNPSSSSISVTGTPAQNATLNIDHSNHNGINATYAAVSEDSNQSAPPSFKNVAGGDFHQASGSVTRNAGADGGLSTTDFDGDQRVAGGVADIGADEWTPAPYAETGGATLIGATVATVHGTVIPKGGATTQYFNWGLTAAYGNPSGFGLIFAPQPAGNGTATVAVSRKLTGLKPSTTYHYRLRAANETGMAFGADATFKTGPPGTPDPGGSGPEPGQPGGAILTLTGASVRPSRFRVGRRPTAVSAQRRRSRRRPIPRATTIRFTLSEPATVTIAIKRKLAGRRKGRRCVRPTRRLRRARRCTRLIAKGTLTRRSKLGANSVRFTGRIGRRKLAPGRYAAVLRARDVAGNVSGKRTLAFTILPS